MGMDRLFARIGAVVVVAAAAVSLGCSDESSGPTAADFAKQRAAAKERAVLEAKTHQKKKAVQEAKVETTPAPELGSGNVVEGYSYDSTGKRDPFRSFMWERPDRMSAQAAAGPLEKFDLNQLEVVAVVWRTGNARALVEDPSGESHIVGEGTAIGKNQGHVVRIDDDSVVVKETYVDYLGQETTKDVEMRMRRNEGG